MATRPSSGRSSQGERSASQKLGLVKNEKNLLGGCRAHRDAWIISVFRRHRGNQGTAYRNLEIEPALSGNSLSRARQCTTIRSGVLGVVTGRTRPPMRQPPSFPVSCTTHSGGGVPSSLIVDACNSANFTGCGAIELTSCRVWA
jgi:hypothetical protein